MALEAAVGSISVAEDKLGETIANATHFLTFTGKATPNEAAEHIYYDAIPEPANGAEHHTLAELQAVRPFCIVYTSPLNGARWVKRAANSYVAGGTLVARFERDAPANENFEESERSWKNMLGKLIRQTTEADPFVGILDQGYTDDRVMIERCQVLSIFRATDQEVASMGDYQTAVIEFTWGPDQ